MNPVEILKIHHVTKRFDELLALDKINVTLNQREILGMIGPNGSGKTTLFNVISGIYPINSGEILFKEESINGEKPHKICRMGIARTFQIAQPFSQMSLLQNVLIGAMFGSSSNPKQGKTKSEKILHFVGLGEKIHLTPDEVTTEDRRRLELARALATDPDVILLDEIMAGLTPTEIEEALNLIRKINEQGITIFMVEHIMKAVMSVSHRVIVLNYGVKIAEASPKEVAENPEVIKAYLGDRYA
jgi:branched-chain amino acid transport system ATP-binding protein